ncbi:minor head protein [Staphylococcus phage S-CoN_Ph26]|nr:minor head protein [Staphylococcus phage S-CoN_Ph26]
MVQISYARYGQIKIRFQPPLYIEAEVIGVDYF